MSSSSIVGLIANSSKRGAAALVAAIREECTRLKVALQLEQLTAALIGESSTSNVSDLARGCDLIVVLGGDGTILRAVHDLGHHLRPIFGINLGTLGFLTCLSSADYRQAIQAIAEQRYQLSERSLLSVEVIRDGQTIERQLGLNDAVISRGALSRLIKLEARIDGSLLTEYNADGLIIATPTGSTAYSLSAGGPLLAPDSHAFAITPICPHTLTNRSVIVGDQAEVDVRLINQQDEVYLTVDGQRAIALRSCDVLRIRRAAETISLATMPSLPFFELARRKLRWSGSSL